MTPSERAANRHFKALTRRIFRLYSTAASELEKEAADALDEYNTEYGEMWYALQEEQISQTRFNVWVEHTLGASERFKELREAVINSVLQCDGIACDWIGQMLPTIWRDESVYVTYTMDAITQGSVSLRLLDENAIVRLIDTTPNLLPTVNTKKVTKYVTKKLNAEIAQGFIKGEDIPTIAKRVQNVTHADEAAAIRNARTAVTSARNGARQEVYERAVDMGIPVKKMWSCTHDTRTRDTHQSVDGEVRDVNKRFSNGLMFPGDSSGRPEELYNCRCTMITIDPLIDDIQPTTNGGNVVGYKTYKEWAAENDVEE